MLQKNTFSKNKLKCIKVKISKLTWSVFLSIRELNLPPFISYVQSLV